MSTSSDAHMDASGKQLNEIQIKIQRAIYDGHNEISVEYRLTPDTVEYLKKHSYKIRESGGNIIIYW